MFTFSNTVVLFLKCFLITFVCAENDENDVLNSLNSWKKLLKTLPNYQLPHVLYSENSIFPNCIFIFGGAIESASSDFYCFDIVSNYLNTSFQTAYNPNIYINAESAFPSTILYNNNWIYYAIDDGTVYGMDLFSFNSNKKFEWDASDTAMLYDSMHFSNIIFGVTGSYGASNDVSSLKIYDIDKGGSSFKINNLNYDLTFPKCIINDYIDNIPYLYCFGHNNVQRINLNNVYQYYNNMFNNINITVVWETLNLSNDSINIDYYIPSTIVSIENYIIFSSYDNTTNIYYFNVINKQFNFILDAYIVADVMIQAVYVISLACFCFCFWLCFLESRFSVLEFAITLLRIVP